MVVNKGTLGSGPKKRQLFLLIINVAGDLKTLNTKQLM
jgi:hypothetical protein